MLRRGARVAVAALLAGCAAAPYTRRSQLILISPEEENKLGARAFQQVLVAQAAGSLLGAWLGGGPGPNTILAAYGLGAQLGVLLPYSRTQESEADQIGLLLMARAGYDPRGALAFWQRMERAAGGAPPEFLSTHPSHGTREQQIQAWLPEAMRYYEASAHAGVEPLPAIAGAMARSTPRSDRAHEFFTCNRFRAGVSAPFLVLSFPNDAMG